ncbi:MAG: LysM peptidoglycan-binding domain-containing C40 family peptidase [Campylobacterota bacterium]|nr:LysM peptidoglycan-binding domain-containing C40 family peptidase [Campylobacterota bacterium]
MRQIILSALLCSTLLTSKSVASKPLKMTLLLNGNATDVRLSTFYKVRRGDTYASIARKHHVSIDRLKKANGVKKNHALIIGKKLQIPGEEIGSNDIVFLANGKARPMLKEAKQHLGKRYVWGAVGPAKFDCSGFTSYVCKKNGISLPRTSIMQAKVGQKIDRKHLKPGDLIFFDTSKEKKGIVNHVGIYLGNSKFIHASSSKNKVMISSLNKSFYKSRFKWGRRLNS